MEAEFTEQHLTRSNKHEATFLGKEIARESTYKKGDKNWTLVRVFVTDAGDYRVGIAHKSSWDTKKKYYSSIKCKTLEDVERVLREADLGIEYSDRYKAMISKIMEGLNEQIKCSN